MVISNGGVYTYRSRDPANDEDDRISRKPPDHPVVPCHFNPVILDNRRGSRLTRGVFSLHCSWLLNKFSQGKEDMAVDEGDVDNDKPKPAVEGDVSPYLPPFAVVDPAYIA